MTHATAHDKIAGFFMARLYSVVHNYLIAFLCLLIDTQIDSTAWLVAASLREDGNTPSLLHGGATALGDMLNFWWRLNIVFLSGFP